MVYQQVATCIKIGLLCQEHDPSKRPFIWDMIHDIREIEGINGKISNACEHSFRQIVPYSEDNMLGIEPLELHFPFELNKQMSCALQLTNETNSYIAFNIQNTSPLSYCTKPQKDIMPPRSKCTVEMTMQLQGKAPGYMHRANELTVWSTKVNDSLAVEDITTNMFINEVVNTVDEVNLDVVFDAQLQNELLDVHPLELGVSFESNKFVVKSSTARQELPLEIQCKDKSLVLGTIVSKDQVDSTQPQEASSETSEAQEPLEGDDENMCISDEDLNARVAQAPPCLLQLFV